jgi:hypothetical protein
MCCPLVVANNRHHLINLVSRPKHAYWLPSRCGARTPDGEIALNDYVAAGIGAAGWLPRDAAIGLKLTGACGGVGFTSDCAVTVDAPAKLSFRQSHQEWRWNGGSAFNDHFKSGWSGKS